MKNSIEVKHVDYSYSKEDHAIKDISFSIEEETWVSIIGHNGSGKSTLSKLLTGLLAADKGEIYIEGILLTEENVDKIKPKIGIVFQNPDNQFVGITVKHDIAFGLENRCVPREEMIPLIEKVATEVGMQDFIDAQPSNLSGGQKQRVAIAGLLAMNPDIMIFDEATSMLDPEGSEAVIHLISELKKYHKTIITITHDLDFARLSDRILVMNDGNIVLDGKPDDVFNQVDVLKASHLDVPAKLKLYQFVKQNNQTAKHPNQELEELLCQYAFSK